MTARGDYLEATALFAAMPSLYFGELLNDLNRRLAGDPTCYVRLDPQSHDTWWLMGCAQFHVMVSLSKTAAPARAFSAATTSQATSLHPFDYAAAVADHRRYIHIEVAAGPPPAAPNDKGQADIGDAPGPTAALEMQVLHWVAQFVAQHEGFLALHFGPSDRLFSAVELEDAAMFDWPEPLLIHPEAQKPRRAGNGKTGYALRLRHPRHLPHAALELEGVPVTVPYATVVTLIQTLIKGYVYGALPLAHGDTIRPNGTWALYVRHDVPTVEAPKGRVILSFWDDQGHDRPAPEPGDAAEGFEHGPEADDAGPVPSDDPTEDLRAALLPAHIRGKSRVSLGLRPTPAQPADVLSAVRHLGSGLVRRSKPLGGKATADEDMSPA